jgi:predicted RNase H-like HicB family nuclease
MDHRPANLRPPLREILIHHNHIDRPADPADRIAQANRLGDPVLDIALNDQEVQIAVACEFATRCRAEQDHPGRRPSSIREALPSHLDQLLRCHDQDSVLAGAGVPAHVRETQNSEIEQLQAVRPYDCFRRFAVVPADRRARAEAPAKPQTGLYALQTVPNSCSPLCRLWAISFWSVSEQLDLAIVYEPGDEGWIIASIPEVAGVFSQGRTRDEARTNVIDALRLMLSPEPSDAGDGREREALHLTIAA